MEENEKDFIDVVKEKASKIDRENFDLVDYQVKNFNKPHNKELMFICNKCNGNGMIAYKSELGKLEFKTCDCYKKIASYKKLKSLGLQDFVKNSKSLQDLPEDELWQQKLKEKVLDYIDNNNFEEWLFIGGQVGCGKTTIATQVLKWFIEHSNGEFSFEYFNWDTRWKELIFNENKASLLEDLKDADILYLDDFLRHADTKLMDMEREVAKAVIDYRYVNKKLTILTSELWLKEIIEDFDEAIGSRIRERCGYNKFVISVGRDSSRNYRLRKQEEIL